MAASFDRAGQQKYEERFSGLCGQQLKTKRKGAWYELRQPSRCCDCGLFQNCGKPLCTGCIRSVGGVVYCEPCLAARLSSPAGRRPGA